MLPELTSALKLLCWFMRAKAFAAWLAKHHSELRQLSTSCLSLSRLRMRSCILVTTAVGTAATAVSDASRTDKRSDASVLVDGCKSRLLHAKHHSSFAALVVHLAPQLVQAAHALLQVFQRLAATAGEAMSEQSHAQTAESVKFAVLRDP
jgi:hypothetical protein